MNVFSKKEKTLEEKLVKELVGSGISISPNLKGSLNDSSSQKELQKIVKQAWKNGASVSEIQRVYDENLSRIKKSQEFKLQSESRVQESGVAIVGGLKFNIPKISSSQRALRVTVGGLAFGPSSSGGPYKLINHSEENGIFFQTWERIWYEYYQSSADRGDSNIVLRIIFNNFH